MADTVTEDLTAQADGANLSFTTSSTYITGSLIVEYNGVRLKAGDEYTEDGPGNVSFTWGGTSGCPAPIAKDTVQVQYEIAGPPTPFAVVEASGCG